MFRQRTQPNPQNLVETLNSEEPSSPTPSIPGPELWSVPLRKWGLHGPTMESSQHAPTGDSHKNTAAQAPSSHCSCGRWQSCWVPV